MVFSGDNHLLSLLHGCVNVHLHKLLSPLARGFRWDAVVVVHDLPLADLLRGNPTSRVGKTLTQRGMGTVLSVVGCKYRARGGPANESSLACAVSTRSTPSLRHR